MNFKNTFTKIYNHKFILALISLSFFIIFALPVFINWFILIICWIALIEVFRSNK